MSYGLELKEILDKCDLSKEEREKFEDFMDARNVGRKDAYPDVERDLQRALENDPVLNEAQKKIHLCKQWANIIALAYKYKFI